MKKKLASILVCPICKSEKLKIDSFKEKSKEIIDGLISCNSCNNVFPIVNSIPRMLPSSMRDNVEFYLKYKEKIELPKEDINQIEDFLKKKGKTKERFGFQWKIGEKAYPNKEATQHEVQKMIQASDLNLFKGKLVLDAGCGNGQPASVVAKYAKNLVAIDINESIDKVLENTNNYDNVCIVQADICNLPFKDNTFDFIYSNAVLHHTPNTKKAFQRLVKLVKNGGDISIGVYWKSPKIISRIAVANLSFIRIFTKRMPKNILYKLCWFAIPLNKIPLINTALIKSGILFYNPEIPTNEWTQLGQYDRLAHQYQRYHTEDEVMNWFKESGLSNMVSNPEYRVCVRGHKN